MTQEISAALQQKATNGLFLKQGAGSRATSGLPQGQGKFDNQQHPICHSGAARRRGTRNLEQRDSGFDFVAPE